MDSDSNQSQEMFSDDELLTENSGHDLLKNDVTFVNSSQLSCSNSSSPTTQETCRRAEIPKTPLSLEPFISKAQVWTKDLETPEVKRPIRHRCFSSRKTVIQSNSQVFDEQPMMNNDSSITYFNNSTVDEIVPTSQTISIRRQNRSLSGLVQQYISNDDLNPSEVDKQIEIQERLGFIGETHSNKRSNNATEFNSEINFTSEGNKFNNSNVDLDSEQVNEFNAATLAKRVMRLKKLQEERTKNINYKSFPAEEFTKSLTSLACAQKFNSSDRTSAQTSINNPLGFVPFSRISMKLEDKNFRNENSAKNIQDKNFHGFPRESQDNANVYAIKYHNFLLEQNTKVLHNSPKSCDNFYGFTSHEIEQSHYTARRCKFICDEYLDNNCQISNRSAIKLAYSRDKNINYTTHLSLSVNTGIKTASGNEIFIDIDTIYKSKKLLLDVENNSSEHNIDELVQNNSTQSDNFEKKTISPECIIINEDHHVISNDTKNIDVHSQVQKTLDLKLTQVIDNKESNDIGNQPKTDCGTCIQTSGAALVQENSVLNKKNEEFNVNPNRQTDAFNKSKLILKNDESKSHNEFKTIHKIGMKVANNKILATKTLFEDNNDIKVDFPLMGFQTGHGKSIHISKDALLRAKTTFAQDMNDEEISDVEMFVPCHNKENSIQTFNTIQNSIVNKRKYPTDDETPVGRKKIRIGTDLQRRKLFDENEEKDNYSTESILHLNNEDNIKTDRNIEFLPLQVGKLPDKINVTANPSNNANVISDEVRESIAALLKDEENCNDALDQWSTSPADVILLKNRRSEGVNCWQKSDKNFEKRSRSYPGIGGESENKNTDLIYNKSSLNQKLSAKPPSPKHEDIPEDLYFDSPYSEEFIDTHIIEQHKQKRTAAIMKQQAHIEMKKARRISQVIEGTLLHLKEINDSISLKSIFKNGELSIRTPEELNNAGIDPSILSIDSITAVDYKFRCVDYYGQNFINYHCDGIPIGDNATLIPNDDNLAGVNEFKRCFLASPGVDPTLVPSGYVENHYRWIVWKLASMDRSKTNVTIKFLTPDKVMKQLKYRYDREIDRSQRSALRRILEKDDAPSRRLVLCVSQIYTENNNDRSPIAKCQPSTIELTDGWYSVRCTIDYAMIDNIKKNKVKVGTKLMIYGAELLNLNEGCYPLNIPSDVRFKIHTNSTRRVKWYIKLGYQRQSGPMVSNLKSINPNGGLIGKLIVAVARIYPIIYREKIGDGQFVDRNARCEEKVVIAHETECQSRIEALYAKNADECRGEKWKKELEGRMMNYIPRQRDVIPITKIKVADGNYAALITLWSSGEESQSVFNENTYIIIYNSLASGKKLNELQITTNRYTIFNNLPITSLKNSRIMCSKRVFTSLDNTYSPGFNPCYGEFDTVGIVVSIGPAPHGMKNFETVNLAFKNDEDKHTPSFYLSILFWQGVSSYGFSEIATVGSLIACINLEWRKNTYKSIPTAFCTERTILTRNPKQSHLHQPFRNLCGIIKDATQYAVTCALEIQTEIMKKSRSSLGSTGYNSFQFDSRGLIEQDKTPCNSNNFVNNRKLVTPNSEPRNSFRSIATKARIDKLLNYGSAPTLSPIHLAKTPKIAQNYRSPVDRLSIRAPMPHSK